MNFKEEFIAKVVSHYNPIKICLWEDRPKHAVSFSNFLTAKFPQIESKVILVESAETYLPLPLELQIVETLTKKSGSPFLWKETVSYTGILVDEISRNLLKTRFPPLPGWTQHYHHMTICLGTVESNQVLGIDKSVLGTKVSLDVIALGQDDKAYAAKVKGFPSVNGTPHITMCIAPNMKPVCSNEILTWIDIPETFVITGEIYEHKRFAPAHIIREKKPVSTKKIHLGKLISDLTIKKGKEIGEAIKILMEWMQKNDIENSEDNLPVIKEYIYTNFL
jgi:hypothetical protein